MSFKSKSMTPEDRRSYFYKLWLKIGSIITVVCLFVIWMGYLALLTGSPGSADTRTALAFSEIALGIGVLFGAFAALIEVYD